MITLDSNVVLYLHDDGQPEKQAVAAQVISTLAAQRSPVALQVVGETQNILRRKFKLPPPLVAELATRILTGFDMAIPAPSDAVIALDEMAQGRLSYWDALLIACVKRNGCSTLITEDMQDGATILGVEIVNPFGPDGLSSRAAELLAG